MTVRPLVEIPHEELQVLCAAVRAMGVNELAGESLHLKLFTGGRQWIVETSVGQLVVDIADGAFSPHRTTVFHLSDRLCRFADTFGEEKVSLLTGNDNNLIAYTSGANAAIDLVPWNGTELTPWEFVPRASALVPMRRFQVLLSSARAVPSGVENDNYPKPPVWLQMGDGSIGFHIDWSDFLPSKSTYRMRVLDHQGSDTIPIPHEVIDSVLRLAPESHFDQPEPAFTATTGRVKCPRGEREAIMLAVDGWRLILWVAPPVQERWAARVDQVFAAEGIEVADTDGVEWKIAGCHEVRVRLHHGHPDVARVTSVLLRGADESVELFRELGHLNAASNHIRYWLDEGLVRSAVDVQCTELTRLPDIVRQVSAAAARYAPMLAVLSSTA